MRQPERRASSVRRTPSTPTAPDSVGRPPRSAMRKAFSQRLSRLDRIPAAAPPALEAPDAYELLVGEGIHREGNKLPVQNGTGSNFFTRTTLTTSHSGTTRCRLFLTGMTERNWFVQLWASEFATRVSSGPKSPLRSVTSYCARSENTGASVRFFQFAPKCHEMHIALGSLGTALYAELRRP
jgi:hypothetical protein